YRLDIGEYKYKQKRLHRCPNKKWNEITPQDAQIAFHHCHERLDERHGQGVARAHPESSCLSGQSRNSLPVSRMNTVSRVGVLTEDITQLHVLRQRGLSNLRYQPAGVAGEHLEPPRPLLDRVDARDPL